LGGGFWSSSFCTSLGVFFGVRFLDSRDLISESALRNTNQDENIQLLLFGAYWDWGAIRKFHDKTMGID
jgi:hypothetical protein